MPRRPSRDRRPAPPAKNSFRRKPLPLSMELLENRLMPASSALSTVPLTFEPNVGQTDPQVQFLSRGGGYTLFLTPNQAVLELLQQPATTTTPPSANPGGNASNPLGVSTGGVLGNPSASVVRMQFLGAARGPSCGAGSAEQHQQLPARAVVAVVHECRQLRQRRVPEHLSRRERRSSTATPPRCSTTLRWPPGVDPDVIQLNFAGADQVSLDTNGNLVLQSGGGQMTAYAPVVYQTINGVQQSVSGHYVLEGGDKVGFSIGTYDSTQPLVIDPTLSYASFVGGNSDEYGLGVAVDSAGSATLRARSGRPARSQPRPAPTTRRATATGTPSSPN